MVPLNNLHFVLNPPLEHLSQILGDAPTMLLDPEVDSTAPASLA